MEAGVVVLGRGDATGTRALTAVPHTHTATGSEDKPRVCGMAIKLSSQLQFLVLAAGYACAKGDVLPCPHSLLLCAEVGASLTRDNWLRRLAGRWRRPCHTQRCRRVSISTYLVRRHRLRAPLTPCVCHVSQNRGLSLRRVGHIRDHRLVLRLRPRGAAPVRFLRPERRLAGLCCASMSHILRHVPDQLGAELPQLQVRYHAQGNPTWPRAC
jgi:hypothetical protein